MNDDPWFPIVLTWTPAVSLFVMWLRSSDDPAAVAVGTWCGIGLIVAFLFILLTTGASKP